jgi:peptide/nickel transport system permease protein
MPEPADTSTTPFDEFVMEPEGPEEVMVGAFGVLDIAREPEQAQRRRRKLGLGTWLAIAWMVIVVALALLAPVLPIDDPDATVGRARQGPTADHWFGTDGNGRDVFSRVVWGARASLLVSSAAVLMGLLVGGFLGLVSGYFRGRMETLLVGLFDILLAFPQLVLALALVAVFASGSEEHPVTPTRRMVILIVALGIVSIPILARITRANTLAWSQREFVLAAKAMGAKSRRIVTLDVLPNVLPAMFSITLLGIAVVIVAEGGLSLLGVGVQLPTPSWGNIIAGGRTELRTAPHVVFAPAAAIFLTVLALNYLCDVVRARFDVRESML